MFSSSQHSGFINNIFIEFLLLEIGDLLIKKQIVVSQNLI